MHLPKDPRAAPLRGHQGLAVALAIGLMFPGNLPGRVAAAQEAPEAPAQEIRRLEDAVAREPGNRHLRLELARRLSSVRRYDESADEYRRVLEAVEDVDVRFELAQVLSRAQRYPEAIAEFDHVMAAGRDDLQTQLARAQALSSAERYDEAIGAYRGLLRRWPEEAAARAELIDVLAWAERYDEALTAVDAELARDPADRRGALQRARILNWSGAMAEARKAYERVMALDPENLEAQFERAQVVSWSGLPLTAERLLLDFQRANPSHAPARQQLGDTYRWSDYLGGAQREYEAALRLDPTLTDATDGLAEVRRATRPALLGNGQYYSDSDGFRRWVARGGAHLFPRPDVTLESNYLHWNYRQAGRTVAENSVGLSGAWQPSLRWKIEGGASLNLFDTGGSTGTGFARVALKALDQTTLSLGYSRFDIFSGEPAEAVGAFFGSTMQAVRQKIQSDSYSLTAGHQFTDWLSLSASGRYGQYHDTAATGDNDWVSAYAELAMCLVEKPEVRVGYRLYFLHVARASPNFFSPLDFQNHGGFVVWRQPLPWGLEFHTDFTLTWIKQTRPSAESLGAAFSGGLGYTLAERLEAQVDFKFQDSRLTEKGSFILRQYLLGLTYRF